MFLVHTQHWHWRQLKAAFLLQCLMHTSCFHWISILVASNEHPINVQLVSKTPTPHPLPHQRPPFHLTGMGIVRESVLSLTGAAIKINIGPDASALLVLNNSQVIMDDTDVHSNDNDSGLAAIAMLPVNGSDMVAPAPAPTAKAPAPIAAAPIAAPVAEAPVAEAPVAELPAEEPATAPVAAAETQAVTTPPADIPPAKEAAPVDPTPAVVDPALAAGTVPPPPGVVAANSVTPPTAPITPTNAIVAPSSLEVSASTFWNNTWGSVSCGWPGDLEQLRLETSGAGNWTSPGKSVLQSGELSC